MMQYNDTCLLKRENNAESSHSDSKRKLNRPTIAHIWGFSKLEFNNKFIRRMFSSKESQNGKQNDKFENLC